MAAAEREPISPENALKRARMMVGCYRAKDFVDVEVYCMALVANLCEFPTIVVNQVTDLRVGIPATHTFCPAISEVVEACRKFEERLKLAAMAAQKVSKL